MTLLLGLIVHLVSKSNQTWQNSIEFVIGVYKMHTVYVDNLFLHLFIQFPTTFKWSTIVVKILMFITFVSYIVNVLLFVICIFIIIFNKDKIK